MSLKVTCNNGKTVSDLAKVERLVPPDLEVEYRREEVADHEAHLTTDISRVFSHHAGKKK